MKLVTTKIRKKIIDLPAGSLFTYTPGEIVLKTNYSEALNRACECIVIGTGEVFNPNDVRVKEINNLLVYPIKLVKTINKVPTTLPVNKDTLTSNL